VENLCSPDTVRRVCWNPPADGDVEGMLASLGARPWQRRLVGPLLRAAMVQAEPESGPETSY
jgi:ribonuclease D